MKPSLGAGLGILVASETDLNLLYDRRVTWVYRSMVAEFRLPESKSPERVRAVYL